MIDLSVESFVGEDFLLKAEKRFGRVFRYSGFDESAKVNKKHLKVRIQKSEVRMGEKADLFYSLFWILNSGSWILFLFHSAFHNLIVRHPHRQPAADEYDLAGDERGFVGGQK